MVDVGQQHSPEFGGTLAWREVAVTVGQAGPTQLMFPVPHDSVDASLGY